MESVIQVNENMILHYEDGFLYKVEKPLYKIKICIESNGDKRWYKNGLRHRDNNLPAVEWADGTKYWYENGRLLRKEEN